MNWFQPKFSESLQPRKKQRLENSISTNTCFSDYNDTKSVLPLKSSSWIERYKPLSKNELIIHKKKIEEVETWLLSCGGGEAKVLLLTGPPGSGKMTTLKVLCNHLKVQFTEWITPAPQIYDPQHFTGSYCSQQRSFEEFLIRASRYSSVLSSPAFKRIVIVKDIPNIFLRDPSLFHDFLLKFSNCEGISVVFIITENSLSFDLFPETVKQNLKIKTINFNPITKKSVVTVLNNIIRKEKLSSTLQSNVVGDVSEACEGDLRNAIMSINFIAVKGSNIDNPDCQLKSKKNTKKGSKNTCVKPYVTDPSIDLFHGLGRVLYVKRNGDETFVHNPDSIVDSFISNTDTFINMLQENYPSVYKDVTSASKAANYLATSDFLRFDSYDSLISRDMALSVTVRGLMCSNKLPIKKFQQFKKSSCSKASELSVLYNNSIKSNFCSSNPKTILLDSVTFLNKLSKSLESESERNVIKELSCFYLMDKHS